MQSLTVITLTRNRLPGLRACIERVLPQLAAGDEMLIIDTGSSDGTREHFAQWHHERVRFMSWSGGGSWAEARNFGVREAGGEWLAFLDDDCLAAPGWAARGREGLADADAVGGIVRPQGIRCFPSWWDPEMGWMAGLAVPGMSGPEAGILHYPFTANLWARAATCRAVPFQEIGSGGEDTELYASGREDAQWWRALRTGGWRTRFDRELIVGHAFDPARLSLEYLRNRAAMDGRAWALREGTAADMGPLAYQWWRALFGAWAAAGKPTWEVAAHWQGRQLIRRRQGAALRALAARRWGRNPVGAIQLEWQRARALGELVRDEGKRLARGVARPWLVSRPARRRSLHADRIAILALGYLGDLVMLHAVLRGLMQANPRVGIYVLAPEAARVALGGLPRLNLTVPPEIDPAGPEAVAWLDRWLTGIDADGIVAPYLHGPWGGVVARLKRPVRPICGFDGDDGLARMWMRERLTVQVHKNLALHEIDNLAHLFAQAGFNCEPVPARIEVPAAAAELAAQHLWLGRADGQPIIMLNPDAGHGQKEWTDEGWASLIREILNHTCWRVVVNSHKLRPELESAIHAQDETGEAADRLHWLRQAPLAMLVAWLARCQALVTVDGGPQHLAHGLGIPSLTLYGPMDERRWADRWERPEHRTMRACAFDLTPMERRGLPENRMVALIEPADVFVQLGALMRDVQAAKPPIEMERHADRLP